MFPHGINAHAALGEILPRCSYKERVAVQGVCSEINMFEMTVTLLLKCPLSQALATE